MRNATQRTNRILAAAALAVALAPALPAAAQHGAGHDHAAQDHAAHLASARAAGGEIEDADGFAIPDVEVVTQDGEKVRFYRDIVAGRVVAMNFVFTTCTTVCPPMGAIFGQLAERLGARAGRDVHLISVSVDPATDTPERLAAWAARFGRTPGWTLVTGDKPAIDRLLKALEVFTADFADHAPVTLLGNDEAGAWTRASGFTAPAELESILDGLAAAGVR
jgi:protein SCO1